MKQFLSICTLTVMFLGACTQVALAQSPNVLDGAYVKETNLTKRVVPYPHLREADVMYKRRIWQEIDLRQKFNHTFYFPLDPIQDRKNLFDVIREALLVEGSLVAYSAGPLGEDDEFTFPLSADSISTILNPVTLVKQYDDFGEVIGTVQQSNELSSDKITRYRIKEDWIWDRQRSERYVRILGIAPMMEDFDVDGNSVGFRPLFWLYYPECRYVFANSEVYNMFNDAQRRTYEDLFQKRYFSSYIVKEDNAFNRQIVSYARGLDALAESERIQQELFNIEHDIWNY
ncbi:MAG TPA: gliding motility protein GldN [Flavobacteriales bacterium]|nr:gliding motility protein GldN [Crocinitomicaceae bacterium]HCC64388.1 gliding motility protein GldN [Flavobacteriales bacterium]|tara:strand:- start:367 stop:1227 length:861 start_codon:yes stop_codon:yes gene_type:complete